MIVTEQERESPMSEDATFVERMAKALGDDLYGYVDPVATPNTWATSMGLAMTARSHAEDRTSRYFEGKPLQVWV